MVTIVAIVGILKIDSSEKDPPEPIDTTPKIILEEDILLSTNNVNIDVGESIQVNATVLPPNATYKKISWTSINSNVATVNNGTITGVHEGKCLIHVATENQKIFKVISVTVNALIIDVNKIVIKTPETRNIDMYIGETAKIEYRVEPYDATDKKISIIIGDPSIISINDKNIVTGLNDGKTTITLKANNGVSETINVNIKRRIIDVTSVTLNKTSLKLDVGQTSTLIAIVAPNDATNKSITWKSNNTKVATVVNGRVTAVGDGTAIIMAISNNNKIASCQVTVDTPYESPITQYNSFASYPNVAYCDSNSLKYRIITINGNDWVLAWIKDPSKQLNSALASSNGVGKASAENILNNEISTYGYQNKCLVASNASFFNMSNGNILSDVVISKGRVAKNNGYASAIGVSKNGIKEYVGTPLSTLINDGVMSTFKHSNSLSPRNDRDVDKTNRTVICQVNRNNYVLISGSGIPEKMAYDVKQMTGSAQCYNLDGGGSRKLYYKTQGSSIIKKFGGGRAIPDMLYFVEQ